MIKCVITGCGHSGTRWLAEVLKRAGLPTAHEARYGATLNDGDFLHLCEVSWTAAAWPDDLSDKSVVMVVRHPLKIIASFQREAWFEHESGHQGLVYRTLGHKVDVVDYVIEWWNRCHDLSGYSWRIEDTNIYHLEVIFNLCGAEMSKNAACNALSRTPRNIGTTRKQGVAEPDLSWLADHPSYENLQAVAWRFGYALPDREHLTTALSKEERNVSAV